MAYEEGQPIPVHIAGSTIPLTHKPAARKRRGVSLRSFVLTAGADAIQQILPLNINRCGALVQPLTNAITIYSTRADAQAGGNNGITIPASNNQPYPLDTNDPVWATATVFPTTVCVTATIEGD